MVTLALYFGFVAAAIGGLVALVSHLTKGRVLALTDDTARRELSRALYGGPVEPLDSVEASGANGANKAWLYSLADGRIGIVSTMGSKPLVQVLSAAAIRSVDVMSGTVVIRSAAFDQPLVRLSSTEPEALAGWIEKCVSAALGSGP